MNEKLPHEVVHDLLPSYIDGLTHETTSRMIEDHLEHCDTCRQTYENMKSENEIVKAPSRQIDYLKKIRKKTARNVAAAILATILVIGGGIGLRQYVFGKAADPQYLNTYVSQRDDRITIGGQEKGSAGCAGAGKGTRSTRPFTKRKTERRTSSIRSIRKM
ncbi:zf-HC2 domain-containing protein [uncultured Dubosiella sp.]|uniref:zf-HC2 domain-containing protein n=1 Tax=uncultured Dubosiella sp. TaxID=1937011 RepID=UPI002729B4D1|nr:zf-HC2 domain-containing protein [uncultured Dubosiella sp.]